MCQMPERTPYLVLSSLFSGELMMMRRTLDGAVK